MRCDELITAGSWGPDLAIRRRMADYVVDGVRLGAIELKTTTGSANDVFLEKQSREIFTASLVLAKLGYQNVQLTSRDATGKRLERPDLDARLAGNVEIGLEVAIVEATLNAKRKTALYGIEKDIRDLLDADPTFAEAFGNYRLTVFVNGVGPYPRAHVGSKKEAIAIKGDIVAFIRAREHQAPTSGFFSDFPPKYTTLVSRGAQYHAEIWGEGPQVTICNGAGTIERTQLKDAIRILNRHRESALTYRPIATWLILFLPDPWDRNIASGIARLNPPIDPFLKAYVADVALRIIELPTQVT